MQDCIRYGERGLITLDASTPDPSDAVWQKWAIEGVVAVAAIAYLHSNSVLTKINTVNSDNRYYESRGEPFMEQNRYNNEFKHDNFPPKEVWWLWGATAGYQIYDGWVRPNLPTPKKKEVQPIYLKPKPTNYSQYLINF
ncbi:MAG TPA: hypothetical protein VK152_11410 [Paludibacter sp.]|nr:hypothetical protein [Paludibacter sp.]